MNLAALLTILLIQNVAHSSATTRTLTAKESAELVRAAIPGSETSAAGLVIDHLGIDATDTNYYRFESWSDPKTPLGAVGSLNITYYMVNRITGDVWSGVACREYKTTALEKLQQRLRRKIGLSLAKYLQIRPALGPYC